MKKIGALWNAQSEEQKARYEEMHQQDLERHRKQVEEMKEKGYFIMEDGQRSCDVAAKPKKAKNAPVKPIKKVDRAT